jgi:hypothetical protein
MKSTQLVDLVLPSLPSTFKVPLTEVEQLSLWIGTILTAAGAALFVINHPLWAYGFGGVGLIILSVGIIGYLKFLASVNKNKENFFNFIRDAVEKETGVRMNNRTIAQMWIESPAKHRGRKFFAEKRKGKEFSVKVY